MKNRASIISALALPLVLAACDSRSGPGPEIHDSKYLGIDGQGLEHLKAFEFLLPEALTLGIYCRSDEADQDILTSASQLGRLCLRLFPDSPEAQPADDVGIP